MGISRSGSRGRVSFGAAFIVGVELCRTSVALAFPEGLGDGQRYAGIYCANCHSSTAESDLAGADVAKAVAELAENKHLADVRKGVGAYARLSAEDRKRVAELLEAVDRHSTIVLEAPERVEPGATFDVTIQLTGGAGPVVAVALVDRPHRLFARPAWASGFELVAEPRVVGSTGRVRRSGSAGSEPGAWRETLFEVEGLSSSADQDRWAEAKVVFTLRAPETPADYTLIGTYLYGTEKAVALTTRTDDSRFPPFPLGSHTGASGRVKFSQPQRIQVRAGSSNPTGTARPSAAAPRPHDLSSNPPAANRLR